MSERFDTAAPIPDDIAIALDHDAITEQQAMTEMAQRLARADADIERLRAESDGRRREIERLEHERRTEWTRAERAEAEMERLRAALAVKS